jgi:RHS repeat-associated protein
VLATRPVRRSDFTSANQWQNFTLQFDNPCFGTFEARVWWAGNASMKFAQLTITPLEVATSGVQWLVTDQLGTPRMVFDKTGSLSGVSRHDYLPFGEELYAGTGGRASSEGYNTDNVRQHFTGKERDNETGLDYFGARFFASTQGRFISVDPLGASAIVSDPQSFNRYTYVLNNPLKYVDPDGFDAKNPWGDLTDKERELLAPKLTKVTGKDQMKAAQEAFNKLVTTGTKNDQQIANNVASVQNFVGSLAGDSKVWNQVQSIDKATVTGEGKQSSINFTINDRDAFISALQETKDAYGYNRFVYLGNVEAKVGLGHFDSTRELGYGVTDPSMHIDSGGPGSSQFGSHWDPTSTFTKDTWKEMILDTVPGGIARRLGAGGYHWVGPKASTQAVRQYLRYQGLVPQH